MGRAWQRVAQQVFVAQERRAYGARRLRRVIAVSHGTARELQEFYGVPERLISVVPNGVDHAVFRPAPGAEASARCGPARASRVGVRGALLRRRLGAQGDSATRSTR